MTAKIVREFGLLATRYKCSGAYDRRERVPSRDCSVYALTDTIIRARASKYLKQMTVSQCMRSFTPLGCHIMIMPFLPSPVTFSLLFFFVARVTSLTLNAGQLLVVEPSATFNTSNSSANVSLPDGPLVSSSNLSHLIIQCDPGSYGDDLNYDSCYDAYNQIPHLVPEMSWGPRTQGRWTINLPWRIYSCEFHFFLTTSESRP